MTDHLATAKGRAGAAPCSEGEQSPHLPPQMCEHVEKTKSKPESRTPVSPSQRGRINHPDTLVTRCQSRISVENLGAKPQLSISKYLLQQRRAQRGQAGRTSSELPELAKPLSSARDSSPSMPQREGTPEVLPRVSQGRAELPSRTEEPQHHTLRCGYDQNKEPVTICAAKHTHTHRSGSTGSSHRLNPLFSPRASTLPASPEL